MNEQDKIRELELMYQSEFMECQRAREAEKELKQEIAALKAELLAAREALGFYGDFNNWYYLNSKLGDTELPVLKMVIASIDTEGDNWVGGKRARAALSRIDKVLKGGMG